MNLKRFIFVFTVLALVAVIVFSWGCEKDKLLSPEVGKPVLSANGEALQMAISFFHFNYCGTDQTVSWRGNCHTGDNPTGGYHDAGDHVKFGLPMAFTITMLCWADYEYGISAGPEISRGLDYFNKCGTTNFIYQVGDPGADHAYWGPPEEDPNSRPSYSTSQGSCVIAGTAAALAAAYVTGNGGDLSRAKSLFSAAESAKSDAGYTAANGYYDSHSGFWDELAWAAVWLYLATDDETYLDKAETYIEECDWDDFHWTHCWDDAKHAVILKLAELTGKSKYITQVERQLDWWLPGGGINYTGGGLPWLDQWGVLRYASAEAFLAKIWADYPMGDDSKKSTYSSFAADVISYIEGDNPRNASYIIGYGSNCPQCPHHRAAAPNKECPATYELTGALVGGPDQSDNFNDDINNYQQTEVATDYNACLVAALAAVGGTRISPVYDLPEPPPESPVGTGTGLTGEYYNNASLSEDPVLTRIDTTVDFEWGGGSPDASVNSDQFSVRWTGKVEARITDTYTFYTLTDDGARLWVNNQQIIDDWTDHAATSEYEASGTIELEMGTQYDIRMEYYENGGDAAAHLSWSDPWHEKTIIPQTQLYPSTEPTTTTTAGTTTTTAATTSTTTTAATTSTTTTAATTTTTTAAGNCDCGTCRWYGHDVPACCTQTTGWGWSDGGCNRTCVGCQTCIDAGQTCTDCTQCGGTTTTTTTAATTTTTAATTTTTAETTTTTAETTTTTAAAGCTCDAGCDSRTTISVPFTQNGAGEYCWETTSLGSYINSWNLEVLEINGVDYTNTWSNSFPEKIDGVYYIYYKGSYGWSHFEAR